VALDRVGGGADVLGGDLHGEQRESRDRRFLLTSLRIGNARERVPSRQVTSTLAHRGRAP
jgi:hypothetical protein